MVSQVLDMGRFGQVVKCSRISRAVSFAPHFQPHGIVTPRGRPPGCFAGFFFIRVCANQRTSTVPAERRFHARLRVYCLIASAFASRTVLNSDANPPMLCW